MGTLIWDFRMCLHIVSLAVILCNWVCDNWVYQLSSSLPIHPQSLPEAVPTMDGYQSCESEGLSFAGISELHPHLVIGFISFLREQSVSRLHAVHCHKGLFGDFQTHVEVLSAVAFPSLDLSERYSSSFFFFCVCVSRSRDEMEGCRVAFEGMGGIGRMAALHEVRFRGMASTMMDGHCAQL